MKVEDKQWNSVLRWCRQSKIKACRNCGKPNPARKRKCIHCGGFIYWKTPNDKLTDGAGK